MGGGLKGKARCKVLAFRKGVMSLFQKIEDAGRTKLRCTNSSSIAKLPTTSGDKLFLIGEFEDYKGRD